MPAKPLEWYEPDDHPQDMHDSCILVAHGIGGRYHISNRQLSRLYGMGHLLWWPEDEFTFAEFPTIESAKAAAEKHWQERYAALAQN